MSRNLVASSAATEGERFAPAYHPQPAVVTDGKSFSLGCLNAAIDASGVPRKALAADCGLSDAQFSRLTSGVQGFPVSLLDRLPKPITSDFLRRMDDALGCDPVAAAAEQLAMAAVRYLSVARKRMARMR